MSPYPPPLSPVLLAGLILRPVPTALLQPFADAALAVMRRRHADLFARLAPLSGKAFRVEPTDLPFCFMLRFAAGAPTLVLIARNERTAAASVVVRAPLLTLVELLEGRRDADALFFARDLVIEGDTEAALFLRNTLEAADIDVVRDLIAGLGPLAPLARAAWAAARAAFDSLERDLALLRDAVLAPAHARIERVAGEVRRLDAAAPRQGLRRPAPGTPTLDVERGSP